MSEKINTYIKEKKPSFSVSQKANKNAVFQFMNWELQETLINTNSDLFQKQM